ncbi:MAG: alpha/beta fold hydrolase [Acidimicrobiales bacterium]
MKFFMSELGVPKIDDAGLASLRVPVSLIWGSEDKANKVSVAVAASERFGWPLHIIDGAADDPPMERPEEFVAAVLASSR